MVCIGYTNSVVYSQKKNFSGGANLDAASEEVMNEKMMLSRVDNFAGYSLRQPIRIRMSVVIFLVYYVGLKHTSVSPEVN